MITIEHLHAHLLQILANQAEEKERQEKILRLLTDQPDSELDKVIKSLKHTLKDLRRTPTE